MGLEELAASRNITAIFWVLSLLRGRLTRFVCFLAGRVSVYVSLPELISWNLADE